MSTPERPQIKYLYEQLSDEIADNPVIPSYFLWGNVYKHLGLAPGNSGNKGCLLPNGQYMIKSTDSDMSIADPGNIAVIVKKTMIADLVKIYFKGPKKPSSEAQMHLKVLEKRPAVVAIHHVHNDKAWPYVGRFVVQTHHKVEAGTAELAELVGEAVAGHNQVQLREHGLVTLGLKDDRLIHVANRLVPEIHRLLHSVQEILPARIGTMAEFLSGDMLEQKYAMHWAGARAISTYSLCMIAKGFNDPLGIYKDIKKTLHTLLER